MTTLVTGQTEFVPELIRNRSKIVFLPLSTDDPKQRCPDITLAKQHLGWSPQVHLEDGLRETVAYFRKALAQ